MVRFFVARLWSYGHRLLRRSLRGFVFIAAVFTANKFSILRFIRVWHRLSAER